MILSATEWLDSGPHGAGRRWTSQVLFTVYSRITVQFFAPFGLSRLFRPGERKDRSRFNQSLQSVSQSCPFVCQYVSISQYLCFGTVCFHPSVFLPQISTHGAGIRDIARGCNLTFELTERPGGKKRKRGQTGAIKTSKTGPLDHRRSPLTRYQPSFDLVLNCYTFGFGPS